MPVFSLNGKAPRVADDAFIAPTATVVGDVVIEPGASVWYGAVIRADYSSIIVRRGANVQDGSVLHAPPDAPTEVGEGATIGHLCVVHGATIGAEALIGNGATVLDRAVVGARCLVAAHSLVSAGAVFDEGWFVAGAPAVAKKPLTGTPLEALVEANPPAYLQLAQVHRNGLIRID